MPDSSLHGPRDDDYVVTMRVIKFRACRPRQPRAQRSPRAPANVCFAFHALLQRRALCSERNPARVNKVNFGSLEADPRSPNVIGHFVDTSGSCVKPSYTVFNGIYFKREE